MKNREHFKRRSMKFLLKFWSGDQNFYINLRGDGKFHQIPMRMSSIASPQVINDPFLAVCSLSNICIDSTLDIRAVFGHLGMQGAQLP